MSPCLEDLIKIRSDFDLNCLKKESVTHLCGVCIHYPSFKDMILKNEVKLNRSAEFHQKKYKFVLK